MVVGNLEDQREHSGLRVVQVEKPAEKQRPHFAYGCTHRVALLTEDVPEGNGRSFELKAIELHLLHALGNLWIVLARLADA